MAKAWDQTVGNESWNLKFVRSCNDWEVDLIVHLLSVLEKERGTLAMTNKVVWRGAVGDGFSIKKAYRLLQPREASFFSVKDIWFPLALCFL